ncbi:hypothetical protein AB0D45_00475 [Streptomyces sp. NPDC048352]|uniref:hypothetical protein n=1 Tax=Streptomyces sp. NPDC048352 TaxID=3154718 RepID=UPI0034459FF6
MIEFESPSKVAFSLIKATALDEAGHHGEGPPNWGMHRTLTAAVEGWEAEGTLIENSLLLVEWLAVELSAYLLTQLGDEEKVTRWLRDFGDQGCQTQQHSHPAGPTAIEILSVVTADLDSQLGPAVRLASIGGPYLAYLRDGREVDDARELALTLGSWAGSCVAQLMRGDSARIAEYFEHKLAGGAQR